MAEHITGNTLVYSTGSGQTAHDSSKGIRLDKDINTLRNFAVKSRENSNSASIFIRVLRFIKNLPQTIIKFFANIVWKKKVRKAYKNMCAAFQVNDQKKFKQEWNTFNQVINKLDAEKNIKLRKTLNFNIYNKDHQPLLSMVHSTDQDKPSTLFSILSDANPDIDILKAVQDSKDIDINAMVDKRGRTVLIRAAENGNTDAVIALLENTSIDVNAQGSYGYTTLICAAANGHVEIVKLLLKNEKIDVKAVNEYGETALISATDQGHVDTVKALLTNEKTDVNAHNMFRKTALMIAAEKGHIEIVKVLLKNTSIDVNAKDDAAYTVLMRAAINGHVEIVKLLLKNEKIDVEAVNEYGGTALISAAANGHVDTVKALLTNEKTDVNAHNMSRKTALMSAAENGHVEIVKALLKDTSIDVINAKNDYGYTALMSAAANGHVEIVKVLLKNENIDLNAVNKRGETALMIQQKRGMMR